MQTLAQQGEEAILNALERYVLNREASYEAFKRLDPESSHTRDALALLDKARADLAEFKGRVENEHRTQRGAAPADPTPDGEDGPSSILPE